MRSEDNNGDGEGKRRWWVESSNERKGGGLRAGELWDCKGISEVAREGMGWLDSRVWHVQLHEYYV